MSLYNKEKKTRGKETTSFETNELKLKLAISTTNAFSFLFPYIVQTGKKKKKTKTIHTHRNEIKGILRKFKHDFFGG